MLGVKSPRVGLMTIGTEEGKGNALITETNELLRRVGLPVGVINYAGPIEGFHVFAEHVDVVVCDGFVGNIMLKSWESLVKFFKAMLKEEIQANPLRMTGGLLSKGAFDALKERINPERYGGAPLLGLNGHIIKAHGSSNRHAFKSAIVGANQMIKADMNAHIEADVARANELLAQPAMNG
jgi:glycerol-3-phosphate acyltransferase PlsX